MIYLDNAATTFPKPESVYKNVKTALRHYGGNPGRSSHRLSALAGKAVYECRESIAQLFDGKPENVVFTFNATYALNMAIKALKLPFGRALISSIEHNAVLRTVASIGKYDVFDAAQSEDEVMKSFNTMLERRPSIVVVNHLSNLCGISLPVEKIGKACDEKGIPFVIDASQSAGRIELSLKNSKASAICAPSHKGLFGIQGSGFVLFADKYSENASTLQTFIYGGNGINSLESVMPNFLPERFEGGTLPTPSIHSLNAGIKYVKGRTIKEISHYENALGRRLREGLSVIPSVEQYGSEYGSSTILFNIKGTPSERLAEYLDKSGICVRGGYHCCPLGHISLKTPEGGAVRASLSVFNTYYDVDRLLKAVNSYKK